LRSQGLSESRKQNKTTTTTKRDDSRARTRAAGSSVGRLCPRCPRPGPAGTSRRKTEGVSRLGHGGCPHRPDPGSQVTLDPGRTERQRSVPEPSPRPCGVPAARWRRPASVPRPGAEDARCPPRGGRRTARETRRGARPAGTRQGHTAAVTWPRRASLWAQLKDLTQPPPASWDVPE
jgi:hypothetical protein